MRLHLDSSVTGSLDTQQTSAAGNGVSRGGSRAADGAGSRDSISVSGTTSALNQLSAQRSNRIEQLSTAVRSGQYQVSSAAIGSAILAHAASGHGVEG